VVNKVDLISKESTAIIACDVMWRELSYYVSKAPQRIRLRMLEQELHNTPQKLREEIQRTIDQVEEKANYILIGFGLCSNAILDLSAKKSTIIVPRGHDCITFFLGSKERYADYFNQNPGTFWYNSGYMDGAFQPGPEQMKELRRRYAEKFGEENADYLMEIEQNWHDDYKTAAYITSPLVDNESLSAVTKDCAAFLGWEYDELEGDLSLFEEFLAGIEDGKWNEDKFLVVPPGYKIAATYDASIIKAVPNNNDAAAANVC
jgi:hypothetical protein